MLLYDDRRRQMIRETSRFIEWGLANPDKVRWIPRQRVGAGGFSERMSAVFWIGVFGTASLASRGLLGRLMRWVRPS